MPLSFTPPKLRSLLHFRFQALESQAPAQENFKRKMNSVSFSSTFIPAGTSPPRRRISVSGVFPASSRVSMVAVRAAATPSKVPAEAGKRQPRGITKPMPVSPALQAVVGAKEIPRSQAVKQIWAYIKANNLQAYGAQRLVPSSFREQCSVIIEKSFDGVIYHQDVLTYDPENKRVIICDEKLKNIFAGKDRVGFLEVAGLLSPHFIK